MKTPQEHLAAALGGTLDDIKELDVVPTHVAVKAIEMACIEELEALIVPLKEVPEKIEQIEKDVDKASIATKNLYPFLKTTQP